MKLTFLTDVGDTFVVEIDPSMELENVMALLEAESGVPVADQSIHHQARELTALKESLKSQGVDGDEALLLLRRKVPVTNTAGARTVEQDSEMMRLQILGDPNLMQQLEEAQPELAAAARSDPEKFAILLRQTRSKQQESELARQREIERLNADPYDIEAQRRIEEMIRQEAVLENLKHALEYSPESFGRVTMLYIPVEVNSTHIKAFVDSGAQQTIMSPECAESCGIMRLLDRQFAGIARGVGTAKILGRVHSAHLKVADLHLPCSFTIMEGRDVDLLFGLDMLKAHQACIDLEKNVLRIKGREVPFLSEHELPDKARNPEIPPGAAMDTSPDAAGPSGSSSSSGGASATFPSGGQVLGSSPSGSRPRSGSKSNRKRSGSTKSKYPEDTIRVLMDLGATREVAVQLLDAAAGNVDVAASMMF